MLVVRQTKGIGISKVGTWHSAGQGTSPTEHHHAVSPILSVEWVLIQFGMAVNGHKLKEQQLSFQSCLIDTVCMYACMRNSQSATGTSGMGLSQLKWDIHATIPLSLTPLSVPSSFCPVLGVMLVGYQHSLMSLGRYQDRDAQHLAVSGEKNIPWVMRGAPHAP